MDDKTSQILASYLASVEGGSNVEAFTAAAWWDAVLERSYFGVLQEHDVFTRSDRVGVKAFGMKYGGLYGRIAVPDLLAEMKATENSTVYAGCLHGLEGRNLVCVMEFIEGALSRRISIEVDIFSKLILISGGAIQYCQDLEAALDEEVAISPRLAAKVAFALCRLGSTRARTALACRIDNKKAESSLALEAMIQLGVTEANWRKSLSNWMARNSDPGQV